MILKTHLKSPRYHGQAQYVGHLGVCTRAPILSENLPLSTYTPEDQNLKIFAETQVTRVNSHPHSLTLIKSVCFNFLYN